MNACTEPKNQRYLIGFFCLMTTNILLIVFLWHTVFSQTSKIPLIGQTPIKVEMVRQEDSPLFVTLLDVDNSAETFQTINFSIQNISSKKFGRA
jgi:hypothetical protein